MQTHNPKTVPSNDLICSIEERWQKALPFFRKRGQVLFLSDRYRFWEPPGFVQQSLAKTLCEEGIAVTWLDGMHWKNLENNQPSVPLLKVDQLRCLPGRRLSWVDRLSVHWQYQQIQKRLKSKSTLVWVQGGLDERICERLKEVDVYSVFDDPFLHSPEGPLAEKSKIILCQNDYSTDLWRGTYASKTLKSLPPVQIVKDSNKSLQSEKILPENFPNQIMGYLGAFFPEGFDFDLFEQFVCALPHWGFVLIGRTNAQGMKRIERLKQYSNFFHRSWIPKEQLTSVWQKLKLNLMLYRPCKGNSGAFPVKFLEALQFGVPSVATRINKTLGLGNWVPLSSDSKELINLAESEVRADKDLTKLFEQFFYEMHPKIHLAKIAEKLS